MLRIVKTSLFAVFLAAVTPGIAQAEFVTTNCGAPIQSRVITGNELFETTSQTFVRIRGAVFTVAVPAGQTRCVKVRFTATATCRGTSGNEACFVRALAASDVMHPQATGGQGLGGDLLRPTGLGYQWVRRLGAGQHVIQIQVRALNVPELITVGIENFAMDVEVLN